MLTILTFLAALNVTAADENAILRQVLDKYFVETALHGPDARQSIFISDTMAGGEISAEVLRIPPSMPDLVPELVASLEENNRKPIPLPMPRASARVMDDDPLRTDGKYDWSKVGNATSVVEVSRPGFSKDGCIAVVRVAVYQPGKAPYQDYYLLQRDREKWTLKSSVRGR